jgi:hypothetical protein
LVIAAGVCSEGTDDIEIEIRRYSIGLLQGFFRQKGAEIQPSDYGLMLRRILDHIHQHIVEEWQEQDEGLDLALMVANTSKAYAVRCGSGDIFLFHEGEVRSLFQKEGDDSSRLGKGERGDALTNEAMLQPGDIMVLCNPAVAGVIRERDIAVILRRASEPLKASLFLSAIAERKGAEGPQAALIWEVPNFQGAAILTEEEKPQKQGEASETDRASEESGADHADMAKKHWLNLWRRGKE